MSSEVDQKPSWDTEKILKKWLRDVRVAMKAHYDAATSAERMHYRLGVPVVTLTTLVGTSFFSTIGSNPNTALKIALGFASMAAAVLAALQTFMSHSTRAERHREAGSRFGDLLRELEYILISPRSSEEEMKKWFDDFRRRWTELSIASPVVPTHIFMRAIADKEKNLE